jgi:glutamine synthetase
MHDGVGMVSTLMLKDTSDRTAFKVFEPGGTADLPGFGQANNLLLLADPASFGNCPGRPPAAGCNASPGSRTALPWSWTRAACCSARWHGWRDAGYGMKCGLEVEFHIYRIEDTRADGPCAGRLAGPAAGRQLIHPGYNLLTEAWYDMAEEPLRIVQHTAQALGLPLLSLEIELGPSQVEAVFDATDALTAADNMVLFRNAVARRCAARATTPPSCAARRFPTSCPAAGTCTSRWWMPDRRNVFRVTRPRRAARPADALHTLSDTWANITWPGCWPTRAHGVFCTPTVNGFGRFRPNALAPQSVLWGRDNRGAMLRVVGECADAATRIENRIGEPAANPYLYLASQIHAGLDGMARQLKAPPATDRTLRQRRRYSPAHQPGRGSWKPCRVTARWSRLLGAPSFTTSRASSSQNCRATSWPKTRTTSSGANTSAGSDGPHHDHHHRLFDRCCGRHHHAAMPHRPEPDGSRRGGQRGRHRS